MSDFWLSEKRIGCPVYLPTAISSRPALFFGFLGFLLLMNPVQARAAPSIGSIAPSVAVLGGAGFTLSVTGSNFDMASVVRWNGVARPTAFVSSGFVTSSIPASDLMGLRAV